MSDYMIFMNKPIKVFIFIYLKYANQSCHLKTTIN